MKVAVPPENLEFSVAVGSKNRVDYMVTVLGHLWVADAPLADRLELDEAFLYSELSLVLIVHVSVLEKTALPASSRLRHPLGKSRHFHVCHGQADSVGPNIPRPENLLMLSFVHELMALIWSDD